MAQQPPEDFVLLTTHGSATDAWAPLYSRNGKDGLCFGTFVRPPLCNSRQTIHGGVVAGLADLAMGYSYGLAFRALHGDLKGVVTAQLSVDYIVAAGLGSWLQLEPRTVHAGKTRGVVDTLVRADGDLIARANAVFRPVL